MTCDACGLPPDACTCLLASLTCDCGERAPESVIEADDDSAILWLVKHTAHGTVTATTRPAKPILN